MSCELTQITKHYHTTCIKFKNKPKKLCINKICQTKIMIIFCLKMIPDWTLRGTKSFIYIYIYISNEFLLDWILNIGFILTYNYS